MLTSNFINVRKISLFTFEILENNFCGRLKLAYSCSLIVERVISIFNFESLLDFALC